MYIPFYLFVFLCFKERKVIKNKVYKCGRKCKQIKQTTKAILGSKIQDLALASYDWYEEHPRAISKIKGGARTIRICFVRIVKIAGAVTALWIFFTILVIYSKYYTMYDICPTPGQSRVARVYACTKTFGKAWKRFLSDSVIALKITGRLGYKFLVEISTRHKVIVEPIKEYKVLNEVFLTSSVLEYVTCSFGRIVLLDPVNNTNHSVPISILLNTLAAFAHTITASKRAVLFEQLRYTPVALLVHSFGICRDAFWDRLRVETLVNGLQFYYYGVRYICDDRVPNNKTILITSLLAEAFCESYYCANQRYVPYLLKKTHKGLKSPILTILMGQS